MSLVDRIHFEWCVHEMELFVKVFLNLGDLIENEILLIACVCVM